MAATETWLLESVATSYAREARFRRAILSSFRREHAAAAIRESDPPVSVYDWLDDAGFQPTDRQEPRDRNATLFVTEQV